MARLKSQDRDTRMQFARKVWHLLVAIKDGLVLLLMLLFFADRKSTRLNSSHQ